MSARFATTVHLSLDELARHGGGSGPHRDGWGVGFVQDGDAFVLREPNAAHGSGWLTFLREHTLRSPIVIAHVRRATQGEPHLRNTQPFTRELGGRVHLFAHNGMLPGIEADRRFAAGRFRRVGDTDSEHAFCALLDRLVDPWAGALPALDVRARAIAGFAAELRTLGPANFVYSDGDAVFAYADRRRQDDGAIRPPGLHVLCRTCSPAADGVGLAGVSMPPEHDQEVALVASVPLSAEAWQPVAPGELIVLREGRIAARAES